MRKTARTVVWEGAGAQSPAPAPIGFAESSGSELDAAMEDINHRAHSSSAVLEDMLKRTTPRL